MHIGKIRNIIKPAVACIALAVFAAPGTVVSAAALEREGAPLDVVADWKFQQAHSTGSIDGGDLVIKDMSGNGNDLHMQTYGKNDYKLSDYVNWSSNSMNGDGGGSLKLNGDSDLAHKKDHPEQRDPKGADFITASDAPINKEQFANGYTMEFVYYLPDDFNASTDSWMGLAARQSTNSNMDEHEMGSMSLSISNCKETQFKAANKDNESTMNTDDPNNGVTSWGVTMDHGGVWYHIAVVSDGTNVVTYTNGAKAFRNINKNGNGLYADPTDGRFRIGSSYYNDTFDTSQYNKDDFDKFLRGNLQEVRFSRGALAQGNWIVPNPTEYLKDYGTNDRFVLDNPSVHTMAFLPDTQNAIRWAPTVMDRAIDQFDSEDSSLNLTNIVSLGDVVDNWDSDAQWQASSKVFGRMQKVGVPFLEQPGNHDYNGGRHGYGVPSLRKADNYLKHFGPDSDFGKYQKEHGFAYSPDGLSSYHLVDNGSYKYLVMNIDMGAVVSNSSSASNDDMRWFEQVLKDHPNNPTVVVSHDIFKCSDSRPNEISLDDDSGYNGEAGDDEGAGSKIWNIVKRYNQVFMMYSGHNHGSGQMTLTNDAGNPVLGLLSDYQFAYNGGNAFFQYVGMDEANNKITMRTYSPYSASLPAAERSFFDVNSLTGVGNTYDGSFDFAKRFAGYEHSSGYDTQQSVISLVRGIGALNGQTPASEVRQLYTALAALPDNVKAQFGDPSDSGSLAGRLAAAYNAAFPKPEQPDTKPGVGNQTGSQGGHQGGQSGSQQGQKGDGHGKGQTNAGPEAMASTGADVAPIVVIAMMTIVLAGVLALVKREHHLSH